MFLKKTIFGLFILNILFLMFILVLFIIQRGTFIFLIVDPVLLIIIGVLSFKNKEYGLKYFLISTMISNIIYVLIISFYFNRYIFWIIPFIHIILSVYSYKYKFSIENKSYRIIYIIFSIIFFFIAIVMSVNIFYLLITFSVLFLLNLILVFWEKPKFLISYILSIIPLFFILFYLSVIGSMQ